MKSPPAAPPEQKGPRDYLDYVNDPKLATDYAAYQVKYAAEPKECDKRTAQLVRQCLQATQPLRGRPKILDVGCSTGNFLRHVSSIVPNADFTGGDLMLPVINECRNAPDLRGIKFDVMDILDLPRSEFDVIVVNAVTYLFDQPLLERAAKSIAAALNSGGVHIGYELVFPGSREDTLVEKSAWHPQGLRLTLRSEDNTRAAFEAAGFEKVEVIPFDIPIDLPKPEVDAGLVTHTTRDPITNRRLMWRGPLFQPWAHIVASKA